MSEVMNVGQSEKIMELPNAVPSSLPSPTLARVNSYKRCLGRKQLLWCRSVEKKRKKLERKQSVADIRLISFPGRERGK